MTTSSGDRCNGSRSDTFSGIRQNKKKTEKKEKKHVYSEHDWFVSNSES
jgi:hypothetical protein